MYLLVNTSNVSERYTEKCVHKYAVKKSMGIEFHPVHKVERITSWCICLCYELVFTVVLFATGTERQVYKRERCSARAPEKNLARCRECFFSSSFNTKRNLYPPFTSASVSPATPVFPF